MKLPVHDYLLPQKLSQMLVDQSFWQSANAAKPTAAKVSSNTFCLAMSASDTLCKGLPVIAQGFLMTPWLRPRSFAAQIWYHEAAVSENGEG